MDTRHIQLGSGHDGGDRGIHLGSRLQFLAGKVNSHQRESGGAVSAHTHGQHIEGHRRGDLTGREIGTKHTVGSNGNRRNVRSILLQVPHRPLECIGDQVAQIIADLNPGSGGVHIKPGSGKYLVIGQAVAGQITAADLAL